MQLAALASLFAPAAPAIARHSASRQLPKGATMAVPHAAGLQLRCLSGSVWVTHDNDPRDVVLAAGEVYASDRASRMLVYALETAEVAA